MMHLYPAIDLRDGKCVRLYQGDYNQETIYGDDPVSVARSFADAGAQWIHVVDLDAARTGDPANRATVAAIAQAVDVPVQSGGGVRSASAAHALFEAGVERVVIGTAALESPDLVRQLAREHRVAVGLDARGRELAVHGWTEGSGADLFEVLDRFADAGVDAVVVTEISRDGALVGPDLAGLAEVLEATAIDVVASGGISSLDDLRDLAALERSGKRLAGAIAGRAIYEQKFSVAEGVAACEPPE